MKRIACLSQKGGVGKSTTARDLAVQFARNDWEVRIADLDPRQSTSIIWNQARIANALEPQVSVAGFITAADAIKANGVDLTVFDGKPYSDIETRRLAEVSDLIVIPTGPTVDDLHPQVLLAHELVKAGTSKSKIIFVINSVVSALDGQEVNAAKAYISDAGYRVANAVLPRRSAYGQAQNSGRSISEVAHPTLRVHAINLAEELSSALLEEK